MEKTVAFFKNKNTLHGQIIKYLFFGGITFVIDVCVFYLFAWLILPSLRLTDPFATFLTYFNLSIQPVSESTLVRNYTINKIVAFLCSNTFAYVTNLLFVFNDGRHNRLKEGLLFYLFSTFSFVLFTGLSILLISLFSWDVTYSYFFIFILAMLTNFTVRKKMIFKN